MNQFTTRFSEERDGLGRFIRGARSLTVPPLVLEWIDLKRASVEARTARPFKCGLNWVRPIARVQIGEASPEIVTVPLGVEEPIPVLIRATAC